jgi:transposase
MRAASCNEFLCGYRLRFYPTLRQRRYLACAFGVARFVWNWALGTKRDAYQRDQTTISFLENSGQAQDIGRMID